MAQLGIPDHQKKRLVDMGTMLVKNLVVDQILLTYLRKNDVITENTKELIESGKTKGDRAFKVINAISGNSKRYAYERLVEALVESGQQIYAEKLDQELVADYLLWKEQPPDEIDSRISEISAQDKEIIDIIIKGPVAMSVHVTPVKDMKKFQNTEGIYSVGVGPSRRRAIIINNLDFVGHTRRSGTEEDEVNLTSLLTQFDFSVNVIKNQMSMQIIEELKLLALGLAVDTDILLVFIMSHGRQGAIYGLDSNPVELRKDILEIFAPTNCPVLANKPKLFFVQACRNYAAPESSTTSSDIQGFADTLVAYATCAGFVSSRLKQRGSFFMRAIVAIFQRHAHERTVFDMMTQVCRIVSYVSAACTKDVQVSEVAEGSPSKACYLMPYSLN